MIFDGLFRWKFSRSHGSIHLDSLIANFVDLQLQESDAAWDSASIEDAIKKGHLKNKQG